MKSAERLSAEEETPTASTGTSPTAKKELRKDIKR